MNMLKNLIESGEFSKIQGWCTAEKALKLYELITTKKCKMCVEIGVFGGKSLIPIGIAAGEGSRIIGIDAWNKQACLEGKNDKTNDDWWSKIDFDQMHSYTLSQLEKVGLSAKIIRVKSSLVVNMFTDSSIDLLHLDSNHSEEVTCNDVELYSNKIKKGGFWVFNDTNWESTKKAQQNLIKKGFIEIYDGQTWKIFTKK